jgi:hypothetical protein
VNGALFPELDREAAEAQEGEFYPTPAWCVAALLRICDPPLPIGGLWVEPACGEGAIVRAVEQAIEQAAPGCERAWLCIELRKAAAEQAYRNLKDLSDRVSVAHGDFFNVSAAQPSPLRFAEVYITNPPFSRALDFASACLKLAGKRGSVALLLRQAFTETPTRGAFLRENPCDLYTLDKRPKFTGKGQDKWAYAWFVWGPGRGGRWKAVECP